MSTQVLTIDRVEVDSDGSELRFVRSDCRLVRTAALDEEVSHRVFPAIQYLTMIQGQQDGKMDRGSFARSVHG